jgi:hypothetical protein
MFCSGTTEKIMAGGFDSDTQVVGLGKSDSSLERGEQSSCRARRGVNLNMVNVCCIDRIKRDISLSTCSAIM